MELIESLIARLTDGRANRPGMLFAGDCSNASRLYVTFHRCTLRAVGRRTSIDIDDALFSQAMIAAGLSTKVVGGAHPTMWATWRGIMLLMEFGRGRRVSEADLAVAFIMSRIVISTGVK